MFRGKVRRLSAAFIAAGIVAFGISGCGLMSGVKQAVSSVPAADDVVIDFLKDLGSGDTSAAQLKLRNPVGATGMVDEAGGVAANLSPSIKPNQNISEVEVEVLAEKAEGSERTSSVRATYKMGSDLVSDEFRLTLDEDQESPRWEIDHGLPLLLVPADASYSIVMNGEMIPRSGGLYFVAPGEYDVVFSWDNGIIADVEETVNFQLRDAATAEPTVLALESILDPSTFTLSDEGHEQVLKKSKDVIGVCFTAFCTKNGTEIWTLDGWGPLMAQALPEAPPSFTFDSDSLIQVSWPATAHLQGESSGQFKEVVLTPPVAGMWRFALDLDPEAGVEISQQGRTSVAVGAASLRFELPG